MKPNTAYLSIGSNLGNRSENIKKCLSHISAISIIKATSSIIETEPFKVSIKQDNFLNLVVKIEFLRDHFELLNDINFKNYLGGILQNIIEDSLDNGDFKIGNNRSDTCLLYTSPSPRD